MPCQKKSISQSQYGFTIIEAIVAVSIFTIALGAVYAIVSRSIALGAAFRNELVAANLAQEGVEVVRDIRDTNWLSGGVSDGVDCMLGNWREGLCNGTWQADFDDTALTTCSGFCSILNFNSASGIYSYDPPATPSIFARKITLSDTAPLPSAREFIVQVEVSWLGKGGLRCPAPYADRSCLTIEDRLQNWLVPQ